MILFTRLKQNNVSVSTAELLDFGKLPEFFGHLLVSQIFTRINENLIPECDRFTRGQLKIQYFLSFAEFFLTEWICSK